MTHRIPSEIAVCPYCGGQLWFEVDEWDTETRVPTKAGVHVSCEHEDEPEPDHYQMPYVYWMPLETRVYRWLVRTGYTVPQHTPEEAIRYGPRSWDVWEYGRGWRPKR